MFVYFEFKNFTTKLFAFFLFQDKTRRFVYLLCLKFVLQIGFVVFRDRIIERKQLFWKISKPKTNLIIQNAWMDCHDFRRPSKNVPVENQI